MKQTMQVNIPEQLRLLCELLGTTPAQVMQGFINDVSQEVNSNGSDERLLAVDYFLRVGYGMPQYEHEEVQRMFHDLNRLRWQWPGNDPQQQSKYQRQRKRFLKHWYNEWKSKCKSGQ